MLFEDNNDSSWWMIKDHLLFFLQTKQYTKYLLQTQ